MAQVTDFGFMATFMAKRPAFVAKPSIVVLDLFKVQIEAKAPNRQIEAKAPNRQIEWAG